jgi:hypothetical protein
MSLVCPCFCDKGMYRKPQQEKVYIRARSWRICYSPGSTSVAVAVGTAFFRLDTVGNSTLASLTITDNVSDMPIQR